MIAKFKAILAKILGRRNKPDDLALQQAEASLKQAASLKSSLPRHAFQAELLAKLKAEQAKPISMKERLRPVWESIKIRPVQFTAAIAVVVLVAVVATSLQLLVPQENKWSRLLIDQAYAQDNFEISPTMSDSKGVEKNTSFIVKSKTAITTSDLEKSLLFVPALPFKVSAISDREFSVTPTQPLKDRTIYKAIINSSFVDTTGATLERDYSWAFQVKDVFKVLGTLPADKGTYVPINTGIEITFSQEGFTSYEDKFAIAPSVVGRFEVHKRTLVFVPKTPLSYGTVYTVTLKKGVQVAGSSNILNEDLRFQFETTQPTENKPSETFVFSGPQAEFTSAVAPVLPIYIYGEKRSSEIDFEIYSYPSAEAYSSAYKRMLSYPTWSYYNRPKVTSTAGLTKVSSFKALPIESGYQNFVSFPKPLSPGFYLIKGTDAGGMSNYTTLQISNIIAYASQSETESLIWLNHAVTKGPIQNATVTVEGATLGRTNAQGVLVFDSKLISTSSYDDYRTQARFSTGNEVLVIPLTKLFVSKDQKAFSDADYWTYVYTDRPMYQSRDTVRVWGFVKPIGNAPVKNARIAIDSNIYDYYNERLEIASAPVTIQPNGSFIADLPLKDVMPGWYSMYLEVDGVIIRNHYVTVQNYVKPSYQLKVTSDKEAVYAGDAVNYTAEASFFDGTPVPNLGLGYSVDYSYDNPISTDKDGKAVVTARTRLDTYNNPSSQSFTVRTAKGEEAEMYASDYITVFSAGVLSSNKFTKVNKNQAKIVTTVNEVDLNNKNQDSYYDSYKGKFAANVRVTGTVTETWYEQEETGQVYDFINKVSRKTYSYSSHSRVMLNYEGFTDDKGEYVRTFEIDPKRSYRVETAAYDSQGRKDLEDSYMYQEYRESDDFSYIDYGLQVTGSEVGGFTLGQTAKVEFTRNGNPQSVPGGLYLFTKYQNGLKTYSITPESRYQFVFSENDIPGVIVSGVWFDGQLYHKAYSSDYYDSSGSYFIRFNPKDRALKVEVAADKAKYKPGEKVTLRYTITDVNNQPVAAALNINVVDEAFYSLNDEQLNTLTQLYYNRPVWSGEFHSYISHRAMEIKPPAGGAERGGDGGGDGVRTDFRDTALFFNGQTDATGNGSITFNLPDNITSWRVTSQAISTGLSAGTSRTNIISTLPLFAEVTAPAELLVGDTTAIKVRAYGSGISANDPVTMRVESRSGFETKDTKQSSTAFEPRYFSLGKAVLGIHAITSTVQSNQFKDALRKEISVITSRVKEYKQETFTLSATTTLSKESQQPSHLIFADAGRGQLIHEFYSLAWTGGARVDQQLARKVGKKYVNELYKDNFETDEVWNATKFQTDGIKLLPYSSTDLELSADLSPLANDYFNRVSLIGYFYKNLNDKKVYRDELIWSLYGLSNLGEPVLLDVQGMLKDPSLSPMHRLYMAAALENLGDREAARKVYLELVKKHGQTFGGKVRLNIGRDDDERVKATALAATLAVAFNDPMHVQLWSFIDSWITGNTTDILILGEKTTYLTRLYNNLPKGTGSFTMVVNGQERKQEMYPGETVRITLTKDQRENITFKNVTGSVSLTHRYLMPTLNAKPIPGALVGVTRTYEVDGVPTTEFEEGDIVTVRLSATINPKLERDLTVTDYLPSGLKAIESYSYRQSYSNSDCVVYPYHSEKQEIKFYAYNYRCTSYTYRARVVAKGTYKAEPVIIQSVKTPSVKNFSQTQTVIIK